jgi:predicted nucleotidyltransferase component of viral defense system
MITVHEDPILFRQALTYTQAGTGFSGRLIEKDYFCSVLLEHLAGTEAGLIFKGGTCLAKVYALFYRLSEDLDFVIPVSTDAQRSERSRLAKKVKEAIAVLMARNSIFRSIQPLIGANNSTQYVAILGYRSLLSNREESVRVEVGLREPLLTPVFEGSLNTTLLDPISGKPMVAAMSFPCISKKEAFAEKFRAALSRREVAIRDFFDLDYAVRFLDLRTDDDELVDLVRRKLAIPGNEPVDVSAHRLSDLRLQLDSHLEPFLRARDFAEFDLDRAFEMVVTMAARVPKMNSSAWKQL